MDSKQIRMVLGDLKYFRGVYAADQIADTLMKKQILKNRNQPTAFIVNTHPSQGPGEHWLAFYITPSSERNNNNNDYIIEFFDSFGYNKSLSFIHTEYFYNFIRNNCFKTEKIYTNIQRLQDRKSILCGYYCCLFLYFRCFYQYDFEKIITEIFTKQSYKKNDLNVKKLFKKYLWKCKKLPHDNTAAAANLNQYNISMINCIRKNIKKM